MFNVGDLVASIRIDGMDTFNRDVDGAGRQLQRTGDMAQRMGSSIRSGMQQASVAVTGTALAATGYLTSIVKTGAAYNTLQQTSRAALKTITGSAEAAADQMAKLDDFARNSPFSKATFIQAQQQLLGFGIEAKKVIPILGAVQDATAAVGGSNDQISDIVAILAKVSSSGKITAEDLNMLGERGIDAASLLGAGFNKSAADIRKDITDGAIDAGKAIDVLTEQMSKKFGGAAASVKETWSGTVDRISAAQREIGSALAEPFISQQGGGLAIIWGNQVADVMRAVLGHVSPIVSILEGRMFPGFAALTEALDSAKVVIKSWDSHNFEEFLNQVEHYGPAVAGLAGIVAGFTGSMLGGLPVIGQFMPAIGPLPAMLGAIALASPEVREALSGLLGEFAPLIPVAGDLATTLAEGLNMALPLVAEGISAVTSVATPLVGFLTKIPTPVLAAVAAFVAMNSVMNKFQPTAELAASGVKSLMDNLRNIGERMAVQSALAAMEGDTSRFAGALGVAEIGAKKFGTALKTAIISNPIGIALAGISIAVAAVTASFAASAEKTKEYENRVTDLKGTLDETTGEMTNASRQLFAQDLVDNGWVEKLDAIGLSSKVFTEALMGNEVALRTTHEALQAYNAAQIEKLDVDGKSADVAEKIGVAQSLVKDAILGSDDAWSKLIPQVARADEGGASMVNSLVRMREAVTGTTGPVADLSDYLSTQQAAAADAKAAQQEYAEALRGARAAMDDSARAAADMNTAMEIFADSTASATEQTNALKQALDIFNGGTKTATELERDLNDQTRSLAEAFEVLDENGNNIASTLVDASGQIDTTTAAGSTLSKQVDALNTAMLESVTAAENSAKARGEEHASIEELQGIYDRYTGKLQGVAREAGLSDEQIQGMVKSAFDMPSLIKYVIDNGGTVDGEKLRLAQLAASIIATPDGSFDITEDDIPGLMDALDALGYKVKEDRDGKVTVTGNGIDTTSAALSALNDKVRDKSMTITTYHNDVIRHNADPGWDGNSANGNLYASGHAQAFANGGEPVRANVPPAIYKGRPRAIYKFAEAETVWEAFISGKPSMRSRNREVAKAAVARLGGRAYFGPEAPREDAAFADGGLLDTQRAVDAQRRKVSEWRSEFARAKAARDRQPKNEALQKNLDRVGDSFDESKRELEQLESQLKSQTDRLKSSQEGFYDDLRRGNIDRQGVNGGGMGLVDRLRDAGRDTGGRTGAAMERQAMQSEKRFLQLEKAADRAADAIRAAEDRKRELVGAAEDAKAKLVDKAEDRQKAAVKKAGEAKVKLVDAAEKRGNALVKRAQDARTKAVEKAEAAGAAAVKRAQDAKTKAVEKAEAAGAAAVKRAEEARTKRVEAAEKKADAVEKAAQDRRTAIIKKAQETRSRVIDSAEARAASKLKSETARANALVDTITKKWNAAVDKASKKLSDLTAASNAMSSGIANTIKSKLDLGVLATATQQTKTVTEKGKKTVNGITLSTSTTREEVVNVPVTAKSVKAGLQKQAASAKALASKIKKLGAKGFNAAFINEVMSLGLEQAEPMIDALLSMSAADVKSTQALYNTINSAAESTGKSVADRYYGQSIKTAEAQLKATQTASDKAIKAAQASADKIIANAKAWGDKQVKAATKAGDKVLANATKQGDRIVSSAKAQGQRMVDGAKAQGDRQVAQAKAQADRQIAAAKAAGDKAIASAKKNADRQVAAAKAAGDKAIAAAKKDASRQVAEAKKQGDRLIASATKQGDKAIAEAKRQGDRQIAQAKAQADRQIAQAKAAQAAIIKQLRAETNKIKDALNKGLANPWTAEKKAAGGRVIGRGTATSDSIPTLLSNGEHVWTDAEVRAAGGHDGVEMIRAAVLAGRVPIRRAFGGRVAMVQSSLRPPAAPVASEPQYFDNSQTSIQLVPRPNESVAVQSRQALREIEAKKRAKGSR